MNILGLDGKNYSWNPSANQADTENRSSLHMMAKDLLNELFPHDRVLEEVSLPGSKTKYRNTVLRADFFIPNRNLIIEVHGEQHYKFNKFFFKNKLHFYRAKARDNDKREWCDINSIKLVELNYNEDINEWRRKI
jgi:hypothetical protein